MNNYPWFCSSFDKLTAAFDASKMAHSLLLVAPQFSGKRDFSLYFAQSLMCQGSTLHLNPACGNCKHCRLFTASSHPDFHLLDLVADTRGKLKKKIGIEQIRVLSTKLNETPQLGGWRIAFVVSVELLTAGAFNALLKTLEEPGQNTLLILNTHSLQKVPSTIRSRCQLVPIEIKSDVVIPWLTETCGCDSVLAEESLRSSFGAPLLAAKNIQSGGLQSQQTLLKCLDDILLNRSLPSAFILEHHQEASIWTLIANYFYQVQLKQLSDLKEEIYHQLPTKLASQLYLKTIEFQRAQYAGSNLQSSLQLHAILTLWYEAGRKIKHLKLSEQHDDHTR